MGPRRAAHPTHCRRPASATCARRILGRCPWGETLGAPRCLNQPSPSVLPPGEPVEFHGRIIPQPAAGRGTQRSSLPGSGQPKADPHPDQSQPGLSTSAIPHARAAVRYVVIGWAHDYRCRAGRGCSARPLADGMYGGRRPAHAERLLRRKVVQTGRDERTLLRFSRISIARCADLVRSSASAWGPLSRSVHPVTGAAARDQRPCAPGTFGRAGGQYGRAAAAGDGGRELAIIVVPAVDAGDVLSGYPAWPVRGAASQRGGTGDVLDLVSEDGPHGFTRRAAWRL